MSSTISACLTPWAKTAVVTMAAGIGAAVWKSGVVQGYFEKESKPVADEFVKTVSKPLSDDEKAVIIRNLSAGATDTMQDLNARSALTLIKQFKNSFYITEKFSRKIDKISGHKQVILADGQKYPIEKVMAVLERETAKGPKSASVAELDTESMQIARIYQEQARQNVLDKLANDPSYSKTKVFADLQSGKIHLPDIEDALANIALQSDYKTGKAVRVIKRHLEQKQDYKELKKLKNPTAEQKKRIQQFETQSERMEQIIRGNKRQPDFNIPPHEKLKPGFVYGSTHNLYSEREHMIFNPEQDVVLQENLNVLKAKLANAKFSKHPILKGIEQWELIKKHVNESFPIDSHDAEDILDQLHAYERRNLLGDYLEQGVGLCRHKALLTKIIGDELGLETSLNSGTMADIGHHAWNTVNIEGEAFLMDAHNDFFVPMSPSLEKLYSQGKKLNNDSSQPSL